MTARTVCDLRDLRDMGVSGWQAWHALMLLLPRSIAAPGYSHPRCCTAGAAFSAAEWQCSPLLRGLPHTALPCPDTDGHPDMH
jgi:hypothetical protein